MSELMSYYSDHGRRHVIIEEKLKWVYALCIDFPPKVIKLNKVETMHMQPVPGYPKSKINKMMKRCEARSSHKMSKRAKEILKNYQPS